MWVSCVNVCLIKIIRIIRSAAFQQQLMEIIWSDPPDFAFGEQEEFYFGNALCVVSQPDTVQFLKMKKLVNSYF